MFCYNSYFGIGRVHYFKLADVSAMEKLSKGQIIRGDLQTKLILPLASSSQQRVLNETSRAMFSQIDGLKFIAYLDGKGFPAWFRLSRRAMPTLTRLFLLLTHTGKNC